jgi:hypothetical protein
LEAITEFCAKTATKEAVNIAYELMMNKWIKLHGPEHPYLVAAVLLAAFKNRGYGGRVTSRIFSAMLDDAKNRAAKIPVNSCGYWGCCGEAIACGIFASIALDSSHTAVKERGESNLVTARVLEQISVYGGPRCSKRDSFTAILTTSKHMEDRWKMPLTAFEGVECMFSERNIDCIKDRCPFHL